MSRKLLRAEPTHELSTSRLLRAALAAVALLFSSAAAAQAPIGDTRQTPARPSPTESSPQSPTQSATPRREAPPPSESRTNADEEFELNISERRITREDFEASTAVEVGDERVRGLDLRVGVALGASNIDVLLRNVRGRVRFRASLAPVLQRLEQRPPTRPAPASPPARPSP